MIVEIVYLGYSCFLLRSYDGVTVIVDPYNNSTGFYLPGIKADIVLVSHNHAEHNCVEAVSGSPSVIQGPGYRELGWVKIKGLKSFHDEVQGRQYGSNTVFCWDMRAVRFCHLGDLGEVPDEKLAAEIGKVDVLFIPIGGGSVLDPERARATMAKLECSYIVPMHYQTKFNTKPLPYTLTEFLKGQNNIIIPKPINRFVINKYNLQNNIPKIVAMEYLEVKED